MLNFHFAQQIRSIEERYKSIVHAASTFSCLSLGISCFTIRQSAITADKATIENKTFNLLTLCSESFMLEPDSIKFLVSHGFDFNDHFANGVEYFKGNDRIVL
jgi:target of EGR1 protein 1